MGLSHMDIKYFENLRLKKGEVISVTTEGVSTGLYNGLKDNYIEIARIIGKKGGKFEIKNSESIDLNKVSEIKKLINLESMLE